MSRLLSHAELIQIRQQPTPEEQRLLDHIDALAEHRDFYMAVGVGITRFAQGVGRAVVEGVRKKLKKP